MPSADPLELRNPRQLKQYEFDTAVTAVRISTSSLCGGCNLHFVEAQAEREAKNYNEGLAYDNASDKAGLQPVRVYR